MRIGSPDFESGSSDVGSIPTRGASSQVRALSALVEKLGSGQHFTLECALVAEAEAPLPEPEGEREIVWREGFGWVERPAEVPEPEVGREVAAA